MTWDKIWPLLWQGTQDTLLMTIPSTLLAYVLGIPLGVLLVITRKDHILPHPTFNMALGFVVNLLRSIPFIILLVMLFPLTVSAFPYVARMVESSLLEVDGGVIEAAQSMGSSTFQIIRKVLLPEAMPSLVNGFAICITTILAYTAMAGAAGGDGLGKYAIAYGLNRRDYTMMYASSICLVVLVVLFQFLGTKVSKMIDHRRR